MKLTKQTDSVGRKKIFIERDYSGGTLGIAFEFAEFTPTGSDLTIEELAKIQIVLQNFLLFFDNISEH
jgi:hypothetical protein